MERLETPIEEILQCRKAGEPGRNLQHAHGIVNKRFEYDCIEVFAEHPEKADLMLSEVVIVAAPVGFKKRVTLPVLI